MDVRKRDPRIHPVGRSVACYFCNEFLDEKYLQDHIIQCGSVLESCPKKCGVYVPRSGKDKHVMECKLKKSRPKSSHDLLESHHANNLVTDQLENQILSLRSALAEEKRYRQESQIELQRLQKLYRKSEEFNKQLNGSLENLKRSWFEELEKRKSITSQIKLEMDKVHLQYQILDSWKKQIDSSIEYVKNRLIENDNKLLDAEFTTKNHENRLVLLDRLEMEINMLHQKVNDEQFNRQEDSISWRGELNEFKDFFTQENAMIAALWNDQRQEIENSKKALDLQANSLADLKTKYHSMHFDMKSVSQIAHESSEKLDSHSNEIKNLRQLLEQIRQDFLTIEKSADPSVKFSFNNGKLLWKIENFTEKMDNARDHNTVLHSPVFYSSLNGYKLRLEIFLNGIKKWRGRHVIVSLQVLKGDWDSLLPWPCNIEAKVLLRDQATTQVKNFMKYITAKRICGDEENEDPQESSSQYIFITHATLEKQSFIKDNILFLETIIINDNIASYKKSTEVTNL